MKNYVNPGILTKYKVLKNIPIIFFVMQKFQKIRKIMPFFSKIITFFKKSGQIVKNQENQENHDKT